MWSHRRSRARGGEAVKIISKGAPKTERVWRGTCYDCKSVVEAMEGELTGVKEDQRDGWYANAVECPVCSKMMHFYPVGKA